MCAPLIIALIVLVTGCLASHHHHAGATVAAEYTTREQIFALGTVSPAGPLACSDSGLYLLPQFLFNDSRHTVLNHNSVLFAFGVTIPSSVRLRLGGAVNKAADVFFVFEQVKNGVFPERLASFCKISSAVQFVYDFSVTESPCE